MNMTPFPLNMQQLCSPHCDAREGDDISLLVIHNISLPMGEWGTPYVKALFMGTLDASAHHTFQTLQGLKVSAHLFIDRKGHIIQFVPFEKRAWHAGESSFEGRAKCNDFSIGIELEGSDAAPFTDAQYESLVSVTKAIQAAYPKITKDRIVGHSDIAPTRKTDPGPLFDWNRFFRLL